MLYLPLSTTYYYYLYIYIIWYYLYSVWIYACVSCTTHHFLNMKCVYTKEKLCKLYTPTTKSREKYHTNTREAFSYKIFTNELKSNKPAKRKSNGISLVVTLIGDSWFCTCTIITRNISETKHLSHSLPSLSISLSLRFSTIRSIEGYVVQMKGVNPCRRVAQN